MVPQEWIDFTENMSNDELLYWYHVLLCKHGDITIDELYSAHPQRTAESHYYFTKGEHSNA